MDDSENAKRAVDYVAEAFSPENKVTLLSILPDTAALCDMNSPELTSYFHSQQTTFCVLEDKKRELVEAALNSAKQRLQSAGFPEKNVIVKLSKKKAGIARDVVREAVQGYDLIVMGRRGVSGIKEFFMGSVSTKVFNLAKDVSVLIVN